MTNNKVFSLLRNARREHYAQRIAAAEMAGNIDEAKKLQNEFNRRTQADYKKVKESRSNNAAELL